MADPDEANNGRQCLKCRCVFRDPSTLRRHLNRKRPCTPVVGFDDLRAAQYNCRFCGRSYSSEWNVRRHMKSCPIASRGERGMEQLYAHVLEKTRAAAEREAAAHQEIETLRAELQRLQLAGDDDKTIVQITNRVDSVNITNNVIINVFGQEDTRHITTDTVREILSRCADSHLENCDEGAAAAQAILQAALLIYSDPERPGNITCYKPNKRDGNAMVHGVRGWEIVPVSLVVSPMARASLDLLFDKQPFDDDIDQLKRYEIALRSLRQLEGRLVSSGANLQSVLIRNKELLFRALSQLPAVGSSNRTFVQN